jgi:hypothetical protein
VENDMEESDESDESDEILDPESEGTEDEDG